MSTICKSLNFQNTHACIPHKKLVINTKNQLRLQFAEKFMNTSRTIQILEHYVFIDENKLKIFVKKKNVTKKNTKLEKFY